MTVDPLVEATIMIDFEREPSAAAAPAAPRNSIADSDRLIPAGGGIVTPHSLPRSITQMAAAQSEYCGPVPALSA